ncbi:Putative transporter, AEC family protein [Oceaniovalibus guishaninsula JLT2003]|uniref:Putative transporter, AEC family protein n=1 Tax=Oceaniovalibus guishaninsula JLT2003 TaxID=1231392 RepID=K2GNQ3_9RHOB|nr:AEC family transporter [Oceaniovalibus guishaninsula]EKE44291.1 Putative transporter, AEC family protein [Oceaniovalibus guishaninsula JLT2003]
MIAVLQQTLPFFALIGLGWLAGRRGMFDAAATAALTKFVFYFALSAMLFRFSSELDLAQVIDARFLLAYLVPSALVYALATIVALVRRRGVLEAAVEAQCAVIGNVGFLGIPMLVLLLGTDAIGPVVQVLAVDLIVFGSLIVILITAAREGRVRLRTLGAVGLGLVRNPMIVSVVAGLAWAATGWTMPVPAASFVAILGAAATPGALFAIGASLAGKSAERLSVALWLSTCKLVLHPAAVAVSALLVFGVDPYAAGVMTAAAALPVAGNVYIIAQAYGVAPMRASTSILVSTVLSVMTFTGAMALLGRLG